MSAVIAPIVPSIELKRILFTTDFTEASRRALPIVSAIARRYGARIFMAHVWSPKVYPMVSPEESPGSDNVAASHENDFLYPAISPHLGQRETV